MKNRLSLAIFLLLISLCSRAQIGGDYNPENPSDPGNEALEYTLTVKATPENGGSFNIEKTRVAAGKRYTLYSYPSADFVLSAWVCDGDTISRSSSCDIVMPSHDLDITGVFVYRPTSPSDPVEEPLKYELTITSEPAGAGSFNISSSRLSTGSVNTLYAYARTDFEFRRWMCGDSVLSTNTNLDFVMPSHDVHLRGVFEYNPSNPSNPYKNFWDKQTGEVIIDDFEPGQVNNAISQVINGSSPKDVYSIIVSGRINSNDFGIANNYQNCVNLDFSRVSGVTDIPSYAFDRTSLVTVSIPAPIEKIGTGAFEGCESLISLTCYAITPPELEDRVFADISDGLVVYVPAASVTLYQEAEGWKDMTILPVKDEVRTISVALPKDAMPSDFAQLWLELTNTKNGQRLHYVMTDKSVYTFSNIVKNTYWRVCVRNERGDVFGEIDGIEVKDGDVSVSFESLSRPQTVKLSVKTPENEDVSGAVQVSWADSAGNTLRQGLELSGFPAGFAAAYSIVLSKDLAMKYIQPEDGIYTFSETGNVAEIVLAPIGTVEISGNLKDASTGATIHGGAVSASQTFAGKYTSTVMSNTNENGEFSLLLHQVPTKLTFSANDFVSITQVCDTLAGGGAPVELGDIKLQPVTGATVSVALTFRRSVEEGEPAEIDREYADFNNVDYVIFNKTRGTAVGKYNVQYPKIVLLEEVSDGDVLSITASSRKSAFEPVTSDCTISDQQAEITLPIVEPGKIKSSYLATENTEVVATLYDAEGKFVTSGKYTGGSLTFGNLKSGTYTVVTMGSSKFYNEVYDMNRLTDGGLKADEDYIVNTVEVERGRISTIVNSQVPFLDESRLYYTGDNTSFSVNKASIVAGKYLTLTARLDFKETYADKVDNVYLTVDIPAGCAFVENSVMVGNSQASYAVDGHLLTIPLADYSERIRFCIIPTIGGSLNISANASFDIAGKAVCQPVGSSHIDVRDIAISVPSVINTPKVLAKGQAVSGSTVNVYWDNVLSGTCTANRAGNWQCEISFESLRRFSDHTVWAQIECPDDITLHTESKTVTYDEESPIIRNITMINTAHPSSTINLCEYNTVFDFTNSQSPGTYWYWPSYPKFTFVADIDSGKGNTITDVTVYAKTERGNWVPLRAMYDVVLDKWVAAEDFHSGNLPVNVGLTYHYSTDSISVERFIGAVGSSEAEHISEDHEPAGVETTDNGKTLIFTYDGSSESGNYVKRITADGSRFSMDYTEEGVNHHMSMSFNGTNTVPEDADAYRINGENTFYMQTETSGPVCKGTIYYPVSFIDGMLCASNSESWSYAGVFGEMREYAGGAEYVSVSYEIESESSKPVMRKDILDVAEENCPELAPIIDRMRRRAEHSRNMNRDLNKFRRAAGWGGRAAGYAGPAGKAAGAGLNLGNQAVGFGQNAGNYINGLGDQNDMAQLQNNNCLPPDPDPDYTNPNDNSDYVMDPSGYVYECVPSNRIEGVTATIFYKETVEDMYGDKTENIVMWDAEEYDQKNPVFTDENGMYQWDVPQGLWQVKFEKEGYETAYSEWLPVPPPQMDVNIGMKQNRQPEIKQARAFEDAVEVEFDKYMIPEYLTSENIKVLSGGIATEGVVELLNEEPDGKTGSTYASKVRFNATRPFESSEITLIVKSSVESYAGIRMQGDYSQTFTIEPEVKKIEVPETAEVVYGDFTEITVRVLPGVASNGLKVTAESSSTVMISLESNVAQLDESGTAVFTVNGKLPGTAAVTFTVDGYGLSATTVVDVKAESDATAAPEASVPSGSEVAKGTEITLSCITPEASIYYTLDESCPCGENAFLYDGTPIVINEPTVIKAMAVAPGYRQSDVVEFTYTIAEEGGMGEIYANSDISVVINDNTITVTGISDNHIDYIEIFDMKGLSIFRQRDIASSTVRIPGLAKGVYVVIVDARGRLTCHKVSKR